MNEKVAYLGFRFDTLSEEDLLAALTGRDAASPFAYLVTPNVDHVVRVHDPRAVDRDAVLAAYADAHWCVCDSRILAALARREGIGLPVHTGSDLTATLLAKVCVPGDRIALVGGGSAVADLLRGRFPRLDVLHHEPPMGLRHDREALAAAASFVASARARFVFLSVGSPQQELLARAILQRGDATGTGLCVGAAVLFAVGELRRAPRVLQRLHLEWAFRLAAEPRRMWRRYLVTGPRIFRIARAARKRGGPTAG